MKNLNLSDLKKIIKEELSSFLNEDDPCWDGYTMVGTKTVNGKEVPNCVPDDNVENYNPSKQ